MRLFSLPDGTVDRKDRAQWITVPFDLAFAEPPELTPLGDIVPKVSGLISPACSTQYESSLSGFHSPVAATIPSPALSEYITPTIAVI